MLIVPNYKYAGQTRSTALAMDDSWSVWNFASYESLTGEDSMIALGSENSNAPTSSRVAASAKGCSRDLGNKSMLSAQNCMMDFEFQAHRADGSGTWYCPHCGQVVEAHSLAIAKHRKTCCLEGRTKPYHEFSQMRGKRKQNETFPIPNGEKVRCDTNCNSLSSARPPVSISHKRVCQALPIDSLNSSKVRHPIRHRVVTDYKSGFTSGSGNSVPQPDSFQLPSSVEFDLDMIQNSLHFDADSSGTLNTYFGLDVSSEAVNICTGGGMHNEPEELTTDIKRDLRTLPKAVDDSAHLLLANANTAADGHLIASARNELSRSPLNRPEKEYGTWTCPDCGQIVKAHPPAISSHQRACLRKHGSRIEVGNMGSLVAPADACGDGTGNGICTSVNVQTKALGPPKPQVEYGTWTCPECNRVLKKWAPAIASHKRSCSAWRRSIADNDQTKIHEKQSPPSATSTGLESDFIIGEKDDGAAPAATMTIRPYEFKTHNSTRTAAVSVLNRPEKEYGTWACPDCGQIVKAHPPAISSHQRACLRKHGSRILMGSLVALADACGDGTGNGICTSVNVQTKALGPPKPQVEYDTWTCPDCNSILKKWAPAIASHKRSCLAWRRSIADNDQTKINENQPLPSTVRCPTISKSRQNEKVEIEKMDDCAQTSPDCNAADSHEPLFIRNHQDDTQQHSLGQNITFTSLESDFIIAENADGAIPATTMSSIPYELTKHHGTLTCSKSQEETKNASPDIVAHKQTGSAQRTYPTQHQNIDDAVGVCENTYTSSISSTTWKCPDCNDVFKNSATGITRHKNKCYARLRRLEKNVDETNTQLAKARKDSSLETVDSDVDDSRQQAPHTLTASVAAVSGSRQSDTWKCPDCNRVFKNYSPGIIRHKRSCSVRRERLTQKVNWENTRSANAGKDSSVVAVDFDSEMRDPHTKSGVASKHWRCPDCSKVFKNFGAGIAMHKKSCPVRRSRLLQTAGGGNSVLDSGYENTSTVIATQQFNSSDPPQNSQATNYDSGCAFADSVAARDFIADVDATMPASMTGPLLPDQPPNVALLCKLPGAGRFFKAQFVRTKPTTTPQEDSFAFCNGYHNLDFARHSSVVTSEGW